MCVADCFWEYIDAAPCCSSAGFYGENKLHCTSWSVQPAGRLILLPYTKPYWFGVFYLWALISILAIVFFMQDTVLELEFQGIKKKFTMLQVKKANCLVQKIKFRKDWSIRLICLIHFLADMACAFTKACCVEACCRYTSSDRAGLSISCLELGCLQLSMLAKNLKSPSIFRWCFPLSYSIKSWSLVWFQMVAACTGCAIPLSSGRHLCYSRSVWLW